MATDIDLNVCRIHLQDYLNRKSMVYRDLAQYPTMCAKMVTPYTVGLCLRSWCFTVLLLSVTGSMFYILVHLLDLRKHGALTFSDAEEFEHMRQQMASIDHRMKVNRVELGEDAFVFFQNSSLVKKTHNKTKPKQNRVKKMTEALHGDTSKVIQHENHKSIKDNTKQFKSSESQEGNNAYFRCLDVIQLVMNEIDLFYEEQFKLQQNHKHRHRLEAMKDGFYLNKTLVKTTLKRKRQCQEYLHEVYQERLILLDVFKSLKPKDLELPKNDVTMMTQLSGNRLDKLLMTLDHWSGPISVALYARSTAIKPISKILCGTALDRLQLDMKVHLILRDKERYYPVNLLRNVALRSVDTDYVFLSDADFVPTATAHEAIIWHLDHLSLRHRGRVALVVPAFEALPDHTGEEDHHVHDFNSSTYIYPENKSQLLEQEQLGLVEPFHEHFFPAAQKPTNYSKWRTASTPYRIHYGPYYEPYVVVSTNAIPPYVEEFLGRQMNKVTHIRALYAKHFQFWVLPDVYTVHLPHEGERGPQDYWRCVNSVANMVMLRIQEAEEASMNATGPVELIEHIYHRRDKIAEKERSSEKSLEQRNKQGEGDKKIAMHGAVTKNNVQNAHARPSTL